MINKKWKLAVFDVKFMKLFKKAAVFIVLILIVLFFKLKSIYFCVKDVSSYIIHVRPMRCIRYFNRPVIYHIVNFVESYWLAQTLKQCDGARSDCNKKKVWHFSHLKKINMRYNRNICWWVSKPSFTYIIALKFDLSIKVNHLAHQIGWIVTSAFLSKLDH